MAGGGGRKHGGRPAGHKPTTIEFGGGIHHGLKVNMTLKPLHHSHFS